MREHCRALFHFLSTKRALNARKTGDAPSTKSLKNEHYLHRPSVKAMNLSARSNILGNIINALEMIMNHQRAIHFIWQCCQGKTWSIPSLAVCGKSVILWPIWGGCTCVIFIRFSRNVILSTYTFKNCDKNWGSPGLFRSYSAKYKQQSQLRKIVKTTRRCVLKKKFLTLSLCWIFSFVDTCRYYIGNIFQEVSVEQRW